MKKLKIFLMLSILLCLGFALSTVVHAEEITDLTGTKWLLPEDLSSTSYIYGDFDIDLSPYEIDLNTLLKLHYSSEGLSSVTTWNGFLLAVSILISETYEVNVVNNLVIEDDKNNYLIVPTKGYLNIDSYGYFWYGLDLASADNFPVVSGTLTFNHPDEGTLSLNFVELFNLFFNPSEQFWDEMPIPSGTESIIDPLLSTITITGGDDVTNTTLIEWLETNATQIIEEPSGPKPFEVGDVLPAGYIKISWDFTGKPLPEDEDVGFWIRTNNYTPHGEDELHIEIWVSIWNPPYNIEIDIDTPPSLYREFIGDTPGYTVIALPNPCTVEDIDGTDDYDTYIGDALMWEVVTEEDFIYSEAYQDGYSDGYFLGYKHAREIYGYYDSKTNEWLSVSEYIARYGTDKPGQSDFYANFDKYFIPAMIIVFGGAIVLTILKVFKGRE